MSVVRFRLRAPLLMRNPPLAGFLLCAPASSSIMKCLHAFHPAGQRYALFKTAPGGFVRLRAPLLMRNPPLAGFLLCAPASSSIMKCILAFHPAGQRCALFKTAPGGFVRLRAPLLMRNPPLAGFLLCALDDKSPYLVKPICFSSTPSTWLYLASISAIFRFN